MSEQIGKLELIKDAFCGFRDVLVARVQRPFVIDEAIQKAEKTRSSRYMNAERRDLRAYWRKTLMGHNTELQMTAQRIAEECLDDLAKRKDGACPQDPTSGFSRRDNLRFDI